MPKRVTELHSIMPIENVASVMKHGILSHKKVTAVEHLDVSLEGVQDKRKQKQVPNGRKLHEYANLYFHARNPMLYRLQNQCSALCILRVSKKVLKLPGVVLTDQNAASDYVRFLSVLKYKQINFDWVYAESWADGDQITSVAEEGSKMC